MFGTHVGAQYLLEFALVEPNAMTTRAAIENDLARFTGSLHVTHLGPTTRTSANWTVVMLRESGQPFLEVRQHLGSVNALEQLIQLVAIEPDPVPSIHKSSSTP